MSLGNFTSVTFNEAGELDKPWLITPLDVRVEAYKNWLYVSDEKAWDPRHATANHTVMEVQEGHLWYKDLHIIAERGKHRFGCYFAVWHQDTIDTVQAMVGIACYAYVNGDYQEVDNYLLKSLLNRLALWEIPSALRAALPTLRKNMHLGDGV